MPRPLLSGPGTRRFGTGLGLGGGFFPRQLGVFVRMSGCGVSSYLPALLPKLDTEANIDIVGCGGRCGEEGEEGVRISSWGMRVRRSGKSNHRMVMWH